MRYFVYLSFIFCQLFYVDDSITILQRLNNGCFAEISATVMAYALMTPSHLLLIDIIHDISL